MEKINDTFLNESNMLPNVLIPFSIKFWLLLIPNILSILCSIFVLYHLLFDRTLRQALNNHVIIILLFIGLIYELISVSFMLHYYRFSNAWKLTISFSYFWTFIDYLCSTTQLIGFSWASIERHILIFHNQCVATKKKRLFVHYLPLIIILIYCFTYHFVLILFPFCQNLNYISPVNGVPVPCLFADPFLGKWDTICHQIIPTFIIIIFSIALLVRVLWQKTRLNRLIEWRKQRKMTIQLLSIAILYFVFNFPRAIMQLLMVIGLLNDDRSGFSLIIIFFSIYLVFFFPFVCCGLLPELGKKLKRIFLCQKPQLIAPETLPMNRLGKQVTILPTN